MHGIHRTAQLFLNRANSLRPKNDLSQCTMNGKLKSPSQMLVKGMQCCNNAY